MFSPVTDHMDQLIRFAEALAKLEPEERIVFLDAFEKILHPPIMAHDFMGEKC